MKISDRVNKVQISSIRKLTPLADKAKSEGKKVYHLNIGAPDVRVPDDYFDAINKFDKRVLKYPPAKGLMDLREAISDYYRDNNIDFSSEDIYITLGGSEALQFCMMTIADPGDEILTTNPFYANYKSLMQQQSINLKAFMTNADDGFSLPSVEEIEKKITDKTVAFLIANPSNPTGCVYSKSDVRAIADLAIKHDLYIIADEVYREFVFDGEEFYSFASLEGIEDRLILVDSISKRYGACGARIGSISSKNKEFMTQVNKLCSFRLAVPTLEQIGAAALYRSSKEYFKEVNAEYLRRRNTIYDALNSIEGVSAYKSKGAFYVMPTLPVEDSEDFAKWMLTDFSLDNETVMMAPAYGFYEDCDLGKNQVRLAFVLNCKELERAVEIIKYGLKEYNERKA